MIIYQRTTQQQEQNNLSIECIPPHIQHIIFELLKNATIPSLKTKTPVTISYYPHEEAPQEKVVIKLSDLGGGLKDESLIDKIFHFHFTTTPRNSKDEVNGFGMGLPLCKVFALFNQGDLKLVNNPNVGVDLFITVPRAKDDSVLSQG
ncbi:unnamed protein product [Ambrosiozyma monospora]|uniref:Protein-serine/threonine kinase n=1 Tax=Ambrosiozyma monospora TaxID=43982 RepID=A0A9W7DIT5_AMBMO|nr:unnamed protein product [Ambrosiozyma monospora]